MLIQAVRAGLREAADPEKAPGMQSYMKSAMPFYGVQKPARERLFKQVFAEHPLRGFDEWRATVLALWRGASHREERYAAIALTGDRRYAEHQTLDAVPLYEELIVTGAWWDLVDEVAIRRIGPILRAFPPQTRALMLDWRRSPDLWKRRTSIICQVGFKGEADLDLLYACIEPNLADRDFFIRKAIGWALRQYAWSDPAEVQRYVTAHDRQLSPLSKREALRNVGP